MFDFHLIVSGNGYATKTVHAAVGVGVGEGGHGGGVGERLQGLPVDRKSTRLNYSHATKHSSDFLIVSGSGYAIKTVHAAVGVGVGEGGHGGGVGERLQGLP